MEVYYLRWMRIRPLSSGCIGIATFACRCLMTSHSLHVVFAISPCAIALPCSIALPLSLLSNTPQSASFPRVPVTPDLSQMARYEQPLQAKNVEPIITNISGTLCVSI